MTALALCAPAGTVIVGPTTPAIVRSLPGSPSPPMSEPSHWSFTVCATVVVTALAMDTVAVAVAPPSTTRGLPAPSLRGEVSVNDQMIWTVSIPVPVNATASLPARSLTGLLDGTV